MLCYKCLLVLSCIVFATLQSVHDDLHFKDENIQDLQLFKKKLKFLQTSVNILYAGNAFSLLESDRLSSKKHEDIFGDFVDLFQRRYIGNETAYQYRLNVFKDSLKRHYHMNKKESVFNGTARYGINKFSDWTSGEFKSLLKSRSAPPYLNSPPIKLHDTTSGIRDGSTCNLVNIPYPKQVTWMKKITSIKNQKNCGSCWAFVGSEQMESYWAIAGNPLVSRSPQELLSCAPSLGCNGGNTCAALMWMAKTQNNLVSEIDYPYEEKDTKCRYNAMSHDGPRVKSVCGCKRLADSEDIMLFAVHQKGPLAVNVDAVLWHDYIGGIIQHHCTNQNMNHAVQIIGYNLNNGPVPYWVARNQWGVSFGEEGFIKIKYGVNMCGVAEEPSYIVVQ